MNTNFTKEQIFNSVQIGFEFEFFTKMSKQESSKSIAKVLGKKVVLPYEISGFNKKVIKAKPKEKPSQTQHILTPDYSGGSEMQELVTWCSPYVQARMELIKMLRWIEENGWTTDKCGLHLNISFIPNLHLLNRTDILTLDRLKFCLSFNEDYIFKLFPDRKDNVYAASIKNIMPINTFIATDSFKLINTGSYLTPNTKYYSVNFLKQEKNYLEFRSIGGSDYEKKIKKILDLLEHFILETFRILQDQSYSETDIIQLKKIVSKHKKIVESFANYKNFIYNYPKISLMVNLKADEQIIATYWNILKNALYNLIVFGHMKDGMINYDTDMSIFQIKNTTLTKATEIRNYEIFNSYLDGMFYDCKFFDCEIKRSHIHTSNLVKGNLIEESKIITTPINFNNKLITCYIDNIKTAINGKLEKCIVRHGEISHLAVLDKNCIIIDD